MIWFTNGKIRSSHSPVALQLHGYKGCQLIEASISEDGDTLYLYEDTKADHQRASCWMY